MADLKVVKIKVYVKESDKIEPLEPVTATPADVVKGKTFYGKDGKILVGELDVENIKPDTGKVEIKEGTYEVTSEMLAERERI